MSEFPRTQHDMARAGYRKTGDGICKGCSAPIEWWKTRAGKSIPMNPPTRVVASVELEYQPVEPHWATCPNAKQFKGAAATPNAPKLGKFEMQERAARELRERTDARVVVIVDDFGSYASWKGGIPAEDLRHDLISAGNFVRNEIAKKEVPPA